MSYPSTLGSLLAQIEAHDTDYDKRYGLVLDALSMAQHCGYTAGVRVDPEVPEWPVVYIELPMGQVSWHIPQHPLKWDGHTTDQKYERIHQYLNTSTVCIRDVEVLKDAQITFNVMPVRVVSTWRMRLALWLVRTGIWLAAHLSGIDFRFDETEGPQEAHNVGEA